eukprot:scaffold21196_cov32-Tisochrysis_lutea.AAC.2
MKSNQGDGTINDHTAHGMQGRVPDSAQSDPHSRQKLTCISATPSPCNSAHSSAVKCDAVSTKAARFARTTPLAVRIGCRTFGSMNLSRVPSKLSKQLSLTHFSKSRTITSAGKEASLILTKWRSSRVIQFTPSVDGVPSAEAALSSPEPMGEHPRADNSRKAVGGTKARKMCKSSSRPC